MNATECTYLGSPTATNAQTTTASLNRYLYIIAIAVLCFGKICISEFKYSTYFFKYQNDLN